MNNNKKKDLNQRQKEFYDTKQKNLPTRIWSYFRNGLLNKMRKSLGVEKDIYTLHKSWLGDLSDKKVLDLGCYAGNSLSLYLAQESKSYLGIDLSDTGIHQLQPRLENLPGSRAEVMDFLSDEFQEKNFDLIYAYGVLHHFKDVEELITKLQQKLAPQGRIISHDPLQTSLPIKLIRSLYRPFQSDKDWEWPFNRETYYKFEEAFQLQERRAVLGKAKWMPFLNLLPFSEQQKERRGKKWHRQDWEASATDDAKMFRCMHLSMLLQKKD